MAYEAQSDDLQKHLGNGNVATVSICQNIVYLMQHWDTVIVVYLTAAVSHSCLCSVEQGGRTCILSISVLRLRTSVTNCRRWPSAVSASISNTESRGTRMTLYLSDPEQILWIESQRRVHSESCNTSPFPSAWATCLYLSTEKTAVSRNGSSRLSMTCRREFSNSDRFGSSTVSTW